MKHPVVVVVLAGPLILASCTETQRQTSRGETGRVADRVERDGVAFETLGRSDLLATCAALQTARKFSLFDACFEVLEARVEANGGIFQSDQIPFTPASWANMNKTWTVGMMNVMTADVALNQGFWERAYTDAEIVEVVTRTGVQHFGKTPDESLYGVHRKRDRMRAIAYLGLIEAEWGDTFSARQRIAELEAVDVTDLASIEARLTIEKRVWLGKLHFALDDPDGAYAALTYRPARGFAGLRADLNEAFFALNPASYVLLGAFAGTFSLDDLFFLFTFEPRFLLHRAELETGRLDEAEAGFNAILEEPRVTGFGTI